MTHHWSIFSTLTVFPSWVKIRHGKNRENTSCKNVHTTTTHIPKSISRKQWASVFFYKFQFEWGPVTHRKKQGKHKKKKKKKKKCKSAFMYLLNHCTIAIYYCLLLLCSISKWDGDSIEIQLLTRTCNNAPRGRQTNSFMSCKEMFRSWCRLQNHHHLAEQTTRGRRQDVDVRTGHGGTKTT